MADEVAYLTRRIGFSAMHDLSNPQLSEQENLKIFGKCYRVHGHNYFIEATVKGAIHPESGLCCNRDFLDDVLEKEVKDKFSGTHLNDFFSSTTGEALVRHFYELLKEKLKPLHLVGVRLQETHKNFFTYGGEEIIVHPEWIF